MISSPCSAEQAQRIKLCPRKSPPQSFPPTAQQAPGHFVRGLCCSRAAQPAAEAASGQGPPRMRSIQKALGQPSGGSPALHPKPAAQQVTHSRRGARGGKARLWSDPYRKPSDISSGGFLHPLFLLLRIQCTLACFCRRLRQSAIMAMNSEFGGPLPDFISQ